MSVSDIAKRPTVAIAGGRSKIDAITGVLASGLLRGLVTDEKTARALAN
jgi:DNA-binding transcriptional regulator LsrR (DeoR family)